MPSDHSAHPAAVLRLRQGHALAERMRHDQNSSMDVNAWTGNEESKADAGPGRRLLQRTTFRRQSWLIARRHLKKFKRLRGV